MEDQPHTRSGRMALACRYQKGTGPGLSSLDDDILFVAWGESASLGLSSARLDDEPGGERRPKLPRRVMTSDVSQTGWRRTSLPSIS